MSSSDGAAIPLPFVAPADWSTKPLRAACTLIADGDWVELKDQGGQDFRLLQISNVGRGDFVETGKYRWITEETFREYLYDGTIPDPDLVLRTSGEERVSNFLLWQAAYSELYFSDVNWPDLKKVDFLRAIRSYQNRKRRFGS
jgi:hypothetical protein